jgi:hypothetical protein
MKKYERTAGVVTRGETYAKLNETLIEVEELCSLMAHLHNTEGNESDRLHAQGWLAMAELFHRSRSQVTKLAARRLL